jgi:hypothetical protein
MVIDWISVTGQFSMWAQVEKYKENQTAYLPAINAHTHGKQKYWPHTSSRQYFSYMMHDDGEMVKINGVQDRDTVTGEPAEHT